MSGWEALRRVNMVLLTVALLAGIALLVLALWRMFEPEPWTSDYRQAAESPEQQAEVVANGERRYAIYWHQHSVDPEARSGLKIIEMASGDQLDLSTDPDQPIYQFETLDYPHDTGGGAFAYVALLRSGGSDKRPLFDLAIGDLRAMRQSIVARKVRYLDQPTAIDRQKISMILDGQEGSTFRVFDLAADRFTVSEKVTFLPKPNDASAGAAVTEAQAPTSQFE